MDILKYFLSHPKFNFHLSIFMYNLVKFVINKAKPVVNQGRKAAGLFLRDSWVASNILL